MVDLSVGAEQTKFMFIVDSFVVVFPLTPWLDLFISILSMFCVHIVLCDQAIKLSLHLAVYGHD